jgi:acetyltransferase-like isoleucine patch superfamily enzyme
MNTLNNYNSGFLKPNELKKISFKKIGEKVLISRNVVIVGAKNISIGSNVRIDAFSSLLAPKKELKIGSYVHIGSCSYLSATEGIELKNFSGIGQGVKLYSVSDDYTGNSLTNPTTGRDFKNEKKGKITIGKHVNIGSNSIILPNVNIKSGASVGSFTLVNQTLNGNYIYFGIPAKPLIKRSKKYIILEKKFLKNEK